EGAGGEGGRARRGGRGGHRRRPGRRGPGGRGRRGGGREERRAAHERVRTRRRRTVVHGTAGEDQVRRTQYAGRKKGATPLPSYCVLRTAYWSTHLDSLPTPARL